MTVEKLSQLPFGCKVYHVSSYQKILCLKSSLLSSCLYFTTKSTTECKWGVFLLKSAFIGFISFTLSPLLIFMADRKAPWLYFYFYAGASLWFFWVVLLCWITASLNFSCSPSCVVPCSPLNCSGSELMKTEGWKDGQRKTQDKSRYTEAEKRPPEVCRLNTTCFRLSRLQQLTFHKVPFHILTFLIFNSKAHLLLVSPFLAKGWAVNIQPLRNVLSELWIQSEVSGAWGALCMYLCGCGSHFGLFV